MKIEQILNIVNMPLKINLNILDDFSSIHNDWNQDIRFIFVLKGSIGVEVNKVKRSLAENEFILLNTFEYASIQNKRDYNSVFLELFIDTTMFNVYYEEFSSSSFECLFLDENKRLEKYKIINDLIFKIMNTVSNSEKEYKLYLLHLTNNLVINLIKNFKSTNTSSERDMSNKNRLTKILNYLEENYTNYDLNINDISSVVGLNPQYTLRMFKESLGVGLMDYLNSLRIKKSLKELIHSGKSIIEISIDNGFNDSKSYNRLFKKEFEIAPGEFRKKFGKSNENLLISDSKYQNLLEIFQSDIGVEEIKLDNNFIESAIEVNVNKIELEKIDKYWNKIFSLGMAVEGLKSDTQQKIIEMKSDMNFTYLKFNGVFNDEMFIYNEDERGNPNYNYVYIDRLLDFLLNLKIKPFMNLGFMPRKLASKEEHILSNKVNVSYPKSLFLWNSLVKDFMNHIIERYGEEEVSTWYFEVWNNPDFYKVFWYESDEKFYIFFEETIETIKSVSKNIKVGGPSSIADSSYDNYEWIENYLDYLKKNKIDIDFFSFHSYGINPKNLNKNAPNSLKHGNFTFKKKDFLKTTIKTITNKLKNIYGKKTEIIVNEWNSSPYYLDLTHDTCFMSSFVIENVVNNLFTINGLIYWAFTDNFEESSLGNEIFHGGLGLFTINGLKKAAYNAFILLNKLGDNLVFKNDNFIITSKKDSFQILMHNYTHYNEEYSKGNLKSIDKFSRYDAFLKEKSKKIQISLKKLEKGDYLITKYFLNKESGSVYDSWLEMGAPDKIDNETYQYLKSKEKMKMITEKIKIDSSLEIMEEIDSHEVVFINIKKL